MNKTLSGIKVIELSTFIAVPACARFFADQGADVIKIEARGGDAVRWNGVSEGRSGSPYENTTFDLEMGKGAGCLTAGVTFGNHSREMLATVRPDWIIDRFDALRRIVGI